MARYVLVQLSDLHLRSDDALAPGVSPRSNLDATLELIERSGLRPDLFVLSGDLADAGEHSCYVELEAKVCALAARTGGGVLYVPGNHDDRAAFSEVLAGERSEAPIFETRLVGGLRVIALDSVLPGRDEGRLGADALAYLADAIRAPAPDGTVVVVHHPPIATPIEPMSALRLENADELLAVLDGSDVRLIVSGHNHHALEGTLGPFPVWVSPSTAYLSNPARRDWFEKMPLSSFSVIELDGEGQSVSVVSVPTGR